MAQDPLHIVPCSYGHCISVSADESAAVHAYLRARGIINTLQQAGSGVDDLIMGGDYDVQKVEAILDHWEQTGRKDWQKVDTDRARHHAAPAAASSSICQETCPVPSCDGRCVNEPAHPPGHHYCDRSAHQW